MKPAVVVLFAVVFVCSGVSAQRRQGRCPASSGFGVCVFDPKVNCLDDSACQGGQLCCSEGCNRVCKDPEVDGPSNSNYNDQMLIVKQCPQPSGQFGICSFDENVNCLRDDQCGNGQLCCSEGCNKICKDPVTFQPLKPEPKPYNNAGWNGQ